MVKLDLLNLINPDTQKSANPIQLWKHSTEVIQSLKSRADAKRTWDARLADMFASYFGSTKFLFLNGVWFGAWIIYNSGMVPGTHPFDPYPFGLLTMVVSLEAIILSILVLVSQNRATKVGNLREEFDLQMDTITEQEITKALELLIKIAKKHKIDVSSDLLLHEMLEPTNLQRIETELEKQVTEE